MSLQADTAIKHAEFFIQRFTIDQTAKTIFTPQYNEVETKKLKKQKTRASQAGYR